MKRQIFARNHSRSKEKRRERWLEWGWIVGLLLAALGLLTTNLGSLPLSDREVEIIARGAQEIHRSVGGQLNEFLPVVTSQTALQGSSPFSGVVALFYLGGGVNAAMTRLPGALLAALSVPLVYGIGREIFPNRPPALFSAFLYLMFLPVVHYGRLATLGAPILCFTLLALSCIVRSRRDLRWSLGAGAALGLLSLTHGPIGLLVSAIALLFLALDTPRLLSSLFFWLGILLGSCPAVTWLSARSLSADGLSWSAWIRSTLEQPLAAFNPSLPLWFHSQSLFVEAWPWLLFSLYGLHLAKNRWNWSWAKLVLIWSAVYLPIISLSGVGLPEAILPLYPALALAGGAAIAEIHNRPQSHPYPFLWAIAFSLMSLGTTGVCLAVGVTPKPDYSLLLALASVALTLAMAAISIERQEQQFTLVLFWGMYVSLFLLANSSYWMLDFNLV